MKIAVKIQNIKNKIASQNKHTNKNANNIHELKIKFKK